MIKKCEIQEKFNIHLKHQRKSKRTIEVYEGFLKRFLNDFNCHPSNVTNNQIIEYLGKLSRPQHKQMVATLKIIYRDVLRCPRKLKGIKYPKKEERIPEILSREDIFKLIEASSRNLKHKAIISLLYDSGLRISELLNLKLRDIDSDRLQVIVRGGKGNKDRRSVLGKSTLKLLRGYYREYKPNFYLFESPGGGKYSTTSVRALLKTYCKKAGVRPISPHTLRHSFATHLIESGTPESKVQHLLGHKHITTTQIYNHVTTDNVESLLDVA